MSPHTATAQTAIDQAKLSVIAYNEKNWDACKEALAADAVYDEVPTHRRLTGTNDIIAAWKGWAAAFPDSKASFEDAIADDDKVVLEMRWRGTHNGPLSLPSGPIAATGKRIDVRACQIVELKNGRTQSVRHYFDVATMLQQLGVAK
jgi:steroid delta-isomerase-like uncharacterized protein